MLQSSAQRSALFHAPALWGSSLCLPAPAPLSVPAVSVSFHSLQGAGLHCSYEHRLGRLWAQVQLEQKAPDRSLSLSVPRLPLQGPSTTDSASYLLPTVATQFHVQATNAVLIPHSSAWGLWLRAPGHLPSTVHSSYNFPCSGSQPSSCGPDGARRQQGEALPNHELCLRFPAGTQQQGEIGLQRTERRVGCQSRSPGGRDKNIYPHRTTIHIGAIPT